MEEITLQPECFKRHAVIENHIEEGKGWRSLIITLVLAMVIQIGAFLQMWGSINKMVEINTKRLDRIEQVMFIVK